MHIAIHITHAQGEDTTMYQYDTFDRQLVRERVADFREQTARYLRRVEAEWRVTRRHVAPLEADEIDDLHALWQGLSALGLATPNIGTPANVICCPGLDFCSLANAESISVARRINALFDDSDDLHDLGDVRIKISGCMNACGHHHVGHVGILGVDKKGEEWYQITIGGSAEERTRLGRKIGPSVPKAAVARTVASILDVYLAHRRPDEPFPDTVERIGIAPFRERVYGGEGR